MHALTHAHMHALTHAHMHALTYAHMPWHTRVCGTRIRDVDAQQDDAGRIMFWAVWLWRGCGENCRQKRSGVGGYWDKMFAENPAEGVVKTEKKIQDTVEVIDKSNQEVKRPAACGRGAKAARGFALCTVPQNTALSWHTV